MNVQLVFCVLQPTGNQYQIATPKDAMNLPTICMDNKLRENPKLINNIVSSKYFPSCAIDCFVCERGISLTGIMGTKTRNGMLGVFPQST